MMLPILILLPSLCPPFYMPLLSLHLIGLGIGLLDDVCMGLMRGDVLKLSCCLWFLLVPVCFSIASFSISSSKPLRPIIPFCLVPSSHPLQHIPTHPAIWSNPFTISSLLSSSRRLLGCWFLTCLDSACDVFLSPSFPSHHPIRFDGHCGCCLFCCGCWVDIRCCLFVRWTFISAFSWYSCRFIFRFFSPSNHDTYYQSAPNDFRGMWLDIWFLSDDMWWLFLSCISFLWVLSGFLVDMSRTVVSAHLDACWILHLVGSLNLYQKPHLHPPAIWSICMLCASLHNRFHHQGIGYCFLLRDWFGGYVDRFSSYPLPCLPFSSPLTGSWLILQPVRFLVVVCYLGFWLADSCSPSFRCLSCGYLGC